MGATATSSSGAGVGCATPTSSKLGGAALGTGSWAPPLSPRAGGSGASNWEAPATSSPLAMGSTDGRLGAGGVGPGSRIGGNAPWQHLSPRGPSGLGTSTSNSEGYDVSRGSWVASSSGAGQAVEPLNGGTRSASTSSYAGTPATSPSADLFARPDRDGHMHGPGPSLFAPPSAAGPGACGVGSAAALDCVVEEMQVQEIDVVEEIQAFGSPACSDQPSTLGSVAAFSPSLAPLPRTALTGGPGPFIDGKPILGSARSGSSSSSGGGGGAWTAPGQGEIVPKKGFSELPAATEAENRSKFKRPMVETGSLLDHTAGGGCSIGSESSSTSTAWAPGGVASSSGSPRGTSAWGAVGAATRLASPRPVRKMSIAEEEEDEEEVDSVEELHQTLMREAEQQQQGNLPWRGDTRDSVWSPPEGMGPSPAVSPDPIAQLEDLMAEDL
mmetsp:Transcript_135566/g.343035  ORF Transcript_135566/g.343035 Transcript_135566/m.343035 type:complete len:441 (+) Transcript_135566:1502-2824(+)